MLKGGTDVKWSPPWDYFQNVTVPLLEKMGVKIEGYLNRRGYYPVGNGEVKVIICPIKKIKNVNFKEEIGEVRGIVNIANLPENIAKRIKKQVRVQW